MPSTSIWKKAGFSVNKYFTISARTVERALKQEVKNEGDKRYVSELRVQHLKEGDVTKTIDLETQKEVIA